MPHWRRSFARPLLRSHDDEEQLILDMDGTAAAEAPPLPGAPKMSGETDPPTPMGTGPLSVQREAETAQRADRGSTRERFYPALGRTDA